MSEPSTTEEYLEHVKRQAEEQAEEQVKSHDELLQEQQQQFSEYHGKQFICIMLLIIVAISHIILKLFPSQFGLDENI